MKYCSTCNEKFDDSVSFCPKDDQVLEEDSGSLVGKALDGQYHIEALLGKVDGRLGADQPSRASDDRRRHPRLVNHEIVDCFVCYRKLLIDLVC